MFVFSLLFYISSDYLLDLYFWHDFSILHFYVSLSWHQEEKKQ